MPIWNRKVISNRPKCQTINSLLIVFLITFGTRSRSRTHCPLDYRGLSFTGNMSYGSFRRDAKWNRIAQTHHGLTLIEYDLWFDWIICLSSWICSNEMCVLRYFIETVDFSLWPSPAFKCLADEWKTISINLLSFQYRFAGALPFGRHTICLLCHSSVRLTVFGPMPMHVSTFTTFFSWSYLEGLRCIRLCHLTFCQLKQTGAAESSVPKAVIQTLTC